MTISQHLSRQPVRLAVGPFCLGELTTPGRFGAGVKVKVLLTNIYDPSDGNGNFTYSKTGAKCPAPLAYYPAGRETRPLLDPWQTELTTTDNVPAESERLYRTLQQAVDTQMQETGFVPDIGYGMNNDAPATAREPATTLAKRQTNGVNGNGHQTEPAADASRRATTPADRRTMIAMMRDAVVGAKVAVREMREQLETTRRRLTIERKELETVRRRARLAEQIDDAQTLQIAREYERKHGDRVEVLERKLAAQEAELNLAEREVEDMTRELKSRAAGVERGGAKAEVGGGEEGADAVLGAEDPLEQEKSTLRSEIDRMAREARASEMLAELKRRMGK